MEIIHLLNKHQYLLTGVYNGSVAWGDYDNDGDLDILLSGYTRYDYGNQYQKYIEIMEIIHLLNKHQFHLTGV